MSRLEEIVKLVIKLQELSKAEWGDGDYDCDCGHSEDLCKCDCYMCEKGWYLMEMHEIHKWEEMLLPIVTSRNPNKLTSKDKS